MTFIETTAITDARGEVEALYQRQQGRLAYLPNYAQVFCHRPRLMQAWAELQAVLKEPMDAALGDIGEPLLSLLTVGRAVEARPGEQAHRGNKYHDSSWNNTAVSTGATSTRK